MPNPLRTLTGLLLCTLTSLAQAYALAPTQPVLVSAQTWFSSPLHQLPAQPLIDNEGTALVQVMLTPEEQAQLSTHIHINEQRCGGFFAFNDLAELHAFLTQDHTRPAAFTVLPPIDNAATVTAWLGQVSEPHLRATIEHLSSYQNRYYLSQHGKAAAYWIRDTWLALGNGRVDVQAELFTCSTCGVQPSVILTVAGNEKADEIVIVGAHLDSIRSGAGTNLEQFAPGADDDASGIATVTEIIRIALRQGWRPQRTVKFMAYAAEEVGLRGSNAIATHFASAGLTVTGVLQLDMTNYHQDVSRHFHLIDDYSNAGLKAFSREVFDTYLAPLGLIRQALNCGYACSDHASWHGQNFPAVMASEPGSPTHSFFPYLHTANDTLAYMNNSAEPSTVFARFGLAFIAELAKTSEPLPWVFSDSFETAP